LVVDTHDLARRPGTMRTVRFTAPAPADLGVGVIGVPEGSDIELDLRLESVIEGVLVSGSARVRYEGECVRCLDPLSSEQEVAIQELYVYPDQDADDEGERLQDELLDLEPVLRDAVVLGLPFQPLCQDDCPGLCPECGARLADDPDHGHATDDPRWAALAALRSDRQHDDEQSDDEQNVDQQNVDQQHDHEQHG
jgi:uncharacterized protein